MSENLYSRISIQVSLSGFSFRHYDRNGLVRDSGWLGPEQIFVTPEFRRRHDEVEISLFTPKVALVPDTCFEPERARELLSDVCCLNEGDVVSYIGDNPVIVYSNSMGEVLSKTIASMVLRVDGADPVPVLPEMYYVLRDLPACPDYNKIVVSHRDGCLHIGVSQGSTFIFANIFKAPDFTSALYYILLVLRKLQLNPEVSALTFRTPLTAEEELTLYRYFKAVEYSR